MMALLMIYTAIFERDTLGKLRGDVIAGVGYVTNWYQVWIGQGYTAPLDFAPLRHLWSLAVEEQFYLLWPLVMVALICLGRRRLPDGSAAGARRHRRSSPSSPGALPPDQLGPGRRPRPSGRSAGTASRRWTRCTCRRSPGRRAPPRTALAIVWRPVAVSPRPAASAGALSSTSSLSRLAVLGALACSLHVRSTVADPWLFRGGFLLTDFATRSWWSLR